MKEHNWTKIIIIIISLKKKKKKYISLDYILAADKN